MFQYFSNYSLRVGTCWNAREGGGEGKSTSWVGSPCASETLNKAQNDRTAVICSIFDLQSTSSLVSLCAVCRNTSAFIVSGPACRRCLVASENASTLSFPAVQAEIRDSEIRHPSIIVHNSQPGRDGRREGGGQEYHPAECMI